MIDSVIMIANEDIVCISNVDWDEHWTSKQQIMSRLASANRVLYVERPVSFLTAFTGTRRGTTFRQIKRWLHGVRRERENLIVASPPPVLPLRYQRPLNDFNQWLLAVWLRRVVNQIQFRDPILWIFQPDAGRLIGALNEKIALYHCVDEHAASPFWWNHPSTVWRREVELIRNADLTIVTARTLMERRKPYNDCIYFVSNAADVAHFVQARSDATPIPPDVASLPQPVIGFVGVIDGRFDVDLIADTAVARPAWSFILVGPVMERQVDVGRLRALRNVRFFGNRQISELPAYLKAMQVCLIPYRVNEFTRGIFPLKFFEYLAAGRPVVSTDLDELRPYGDVIYIARNATDLAMQIERALAEDTPEMQSRRSEVASRNTWDDRIEDISRIIEMFLRAL